MGLKSVEETKCDHLPKENHNRTDQQVPRMLLIRQYSAATGPTTARSVGELFECQSAACSPKSVSTQFSSVRHSVAVTDTGNAESAMITGQKGHCVRDLLKTGITLRAHERGLLSLREDRPYGLRSEKEPSTTSIA